jgi:lipopolysaccharide transport system permease protein
MATRQEGPLAVVDAPPAAEAHTAEPELYRPTVREMVRDTWAARSVIPRLGIRIKIKGIGGTKLGRLWLVLRPVISIFGMGLLFGAVLNTPSHGLPYIVFLLVSQQAWLAFERTAFWAVRSFDSYRRVVRNFYMPLLAVPTAALMPAFVEWCVIGVIGIITLAVFSIVDGQMYVQISPLLLLLPFVHLLAAAVGLAIGYWLAPLNQRARDVRIVFRIALQPWMFATPVVYPFSQLPQGLKLVATLNPATAPVEIARYALLGVGGIPWVALACSVGFVIFVGGSGVWFFTREAPTVLNRSRIVFDEDEET